MSLSKTLERSNLRIIPSFLELIEDLVIGHSVVTSSLVDALSSLLGYVSKSPARKCSACNKLMRELFYTSLYRHRKIHQDCASAMINPCWQSVHTFIDNVSLLVVIILLFQWDFQAVTSAYLKFRECSFHVFNCHLLLLSY